MLANFKTNLNSPEILIYFSNSPTLLSSLAGAGTIAAATGAGLTGAVVGAAMSDSEEKEKAQQLNQLLRKVPDDPAILLRNKMQLEAQKRQYQRRPTGVEKSW